MSFTIENLDNDRWDDALKSFKDDSFVASSAFLSFMERRGYETELKTVLDNDEIVALLPISMKKAKRGKVVSLRHGPLMKDWSDDSLLDYVFNYLDKYGRSKGADIIKITPFTSFKNLSESKLSNFGWKKSAVHETDASHSAVIDLTKDEEQLFKDMRTRGRRKIRKTRKRDFEYIWSTDEKELDAFSEIFIKSANKNDWEGHFSKNYLKVQFEEMLKNDQAEILLVKHDDVYIAGAIFLKFNNLVGYVHGGSLREYQKLDAMYQVMWQSILKYKKDGLKVYDFWGVCSLDNEDHPWRGISYFKFGFGADEIFRVGAYDKVLTLRGRLLRFYEKYEAYRKGLN